MADADDFFALMEQAQPLPYAAQVPILEQAVRLADDLGYEDLGAQARNALVSAYNSTNSGPKMFTPFSWLLQRYEDRRPWFDEQLQRSVLWKLKWVTGELVDYPEVPLAQLEQTLASMYRIYQEAGQGLAPVHSCAFTLARHVRGVRGAEREFDTWVGAERTDLSDCIVCEPAKQAAYRTQQGRWQEALDIALPALASGKTCLTQPAGLYSSLIEPLLMVGRADEALTVQRRGWRLVRDNEILLSSVADHVLALARTGEIERGVEALTYRIGDLDSAADPYSRMLLAAAATRLLDAASSGHGMAARTMLFRGREVAFDTLRHELRAYATGLMQRFDARNGTPEVGRHVFERWLQAPLLPALPFPAPVAPPPPPSPTDRHPLAPPIGDLDGLTPERLYDLVELAQRYSPVDEVRTLAAAWRLRRGDLPTLRAGADAARLRALGGLEYLLAWSDPRISAERARPFLTQAAALYRAGGDEAEALLIEQWLLARAGRWDEAAAMIPGIDATGDLGQQGRARLRVAPSESVPRDELLAVVRALPCAVDDDHQLRRIWAAAHSGGADSPEDLYEWTGQGLAMLLPGEYADTAASLHLQRAVACTVLERPDQAAAEFDEAERAARYIGGGSLAAITLMRARIALGGDEPERATPLLERALALADDLWSLEVVVDASGILADVYRTSGRLLEAAEIAERGMATVDQARAGDDYLDPSIPLKQARITDLAAHICADLEETTRATSLYRRAAEQYEAVGSDVEAGSAWGAYARQVTDADTLEAVRALRHGIELMESADEQRGAMVLRRSLPGAVQHADGLDAGLREWEITVELNEANEARALTDSDFREALGDWDFEFERLDLTDTKARMYGTAERFDEALLVLGDVPERLFAHGTEAQGLTSRLLRAQLTISAGRVDDGIAEIEQIIVVLRTWADQESTITDLAGIGARALARAGRDDEADAFWQKYRAD